MRNALHGMSALDLQNALRRSALGAESNSRRKLWLVALAAGASAVFIGVLAGLPSGLIQSSPSLGEIRMLVAQSQRLADGSLTEGLYPLSFPLWPLLLTRFTNEIDLAARVLSGLSAVMALFLIYQLCHSLTNRDGADEQSCFALVAVALSPIFFFAAAGGGTEMAHLALLLASLLYVERAVGSDTPARLMALAGLLAGMSLLLRPISVLAPAALVLWLLQSRPFASERPWANVSSGLAFAFAFLLGAAPQLLHQTRYGWTAWGPAEMGMLLDRFAGSPLTFVGASWSSFAQYVVADDIERIAIVAAGWEMAGWSSLLNAIVALAPTILKVAGLLGLIALCWLDRIDAGPVFARLPVLLVAMFALGGSFGLVDERSLLPLWTVLVIFAFAGLPSFLRDTAGGLVGLALVALMALNQFGVGSPARLSGSYRASDQIAAELQLAGAIPSRVMSASWAYYDTRSPWKERYRHIPAYVNSPEVLIAEVRRQGASYLIFDSDTGANHWPRLASLLETERPLPGLRALQPLLRTDEPNTNMIAIYKLE